MERPLPYLTLIANKEKPVLSFAVNQDATFLIDNPRLKKLRKRIIQLEGDIVINEFGSAKEAEARTGVKHTNICAVLKGRRKSAGNYNWIYV